MMGSCDHARTARHRSECPHAVGTPEWVLWQRSFIAGQLSDADRVTMARGLARERMDACGWRWDGVENSNTERRRADIERPLTPAQRALLDLEFFLDSDIEGDEFWPDPETLAQLVAVADAAWAALMRVTDGSAAYDLADFIFPTP